MAYVFDGPKLDPKEHPHVFAPSTIETAELCFRKYAFDKIDKIPRIETEAQALGTATHAQIEEYLKHGKPFDITVLPGKIAMSALQYLPQPKLPGMRVEKWFYRKTGVATYWGKKDGEQILTGMIPKVWDHKTCGGFRFIKSEVELQSGTQSGIYGWDAIEKADSQEAELNWTYMRTKGSRKSLPVVTRITKMQAEDVMERVDGVTAIMIQLKEQLVKGQAIEAPPNYNACEAFGGCQFKGICKPTAKEAFSAIVEQMTVKEGNNMASDLLNKLKARKAAGKGGATAAETASADGSAVTSTENVSGTAAATDPINPPDRDQPPPPAPEAKKAGGKWFQAAWDDAEWKWKYPPEYDKALADDAAAAAAEKKAASGGKATRTKKTETFAASEGGASDLLDQLVEMIATRVAAKLKE